MEKLGGWICTDNDSLQHLRKNDDGTYNCIEIVWLDTCEGDEGYPDKEYVVKTALIDLNDYTEEDMEIAISGYYPDSTLSELKEEWGDSLDQLIVECIFEEMTEGSASVHGMMTRAEAENFIKKYIEEGEIL